MAFLATLLLMFWLHSSGTLPLAAMCPQGERAVYEVTDLVPEIPEQPSHKQTNFTFFSRRLTVHYHEGQRALLSSTSDGTGGLTGDDVFWMQVQPGGRVWTHDFRDPTRTRIIPIAPQEITGLFTPGVNELEIILQDRTPPVYSSRPWFLLLVSCVPQQVNAVPTSTLQSTDTPTAIPTALPPATATQPPTATPSATPSPTPLPTATAMATPTPQDSVAFLPLVQVAAPVEILAVPPRNGLNRHRWAIAGSVLITGFALWQLQSSRRRNWIEGMLRISRDGQRVRTVNLAEFHKNPVTFGPNDDVPLQIDPASTVTRVQVRKQQGPNGHSEVVVEYLAAAEPGGTSKRAARKMRVVQTQKLRHGEAFTFGAFRLVYQHYA